MPKLSPWHCHPNADIILLILSFDASNADSVQQTQLKYQQYQQRQYQEYQQYQQQQYQQYQQQYQQQQYQQYQQQPQKQQQQPQKQQQQPQSASGQALPSVDAHASRRALDHQVLELTEAKAIAAAKVVLARRADAKLLALERTVHIKLTNLLKHLSSLQEHMSDFAGAERTLLTLCELMEQHEDQWTTSMQQCFTMLLRVMTSQKKTEGATALRHTLAHKQALFRLGYNHANYAFVARLKDAASIFVRQPSNHKKVKQFIGRIIRKIKRQTENMKPIPPSFVAQLTHAEFVLKTLKRIAKNKQPLNLVYKERARLIRIMNNPKSRLHTTKMQEFRDRVDLLGVLAKDLQLEFGKSSTPSHLETTKTASKESNNVRERRKKKLKPQHPKKATAQTNQAKPKSMHSPTTPVQQQPPVAPEVDSSEIEQPVEDTPQGNSSPNTPDQLSRQGTASLESKITSILPVLVSVAAFVAVLRVLNPKQVPAPVSPKSKNKRRKNKNKQKQKTKPKQPTHPGVQEQKGSVEGLEQVKAAPSNLSKVSHPSKMLLSDISVDAVPSSQEKKKRRRRKAKQPQALTAESSTDTESKSTDNLPRVRVNSQPKSPKVTAHNGTATPKSQTRKEVQLIEKREVKPELPANAVPKTAAKPAPKTVAKPAAKTVAKPARKTSPKSVPKAVANVSKPKTVSNVALKTVAKTAPKTVPKSAPKTASKAAPNPTKKPTKLTAKPLVKSTARAAGRSKPTERTWRKPAAKSSAKASAKAEPVQKPHVSQRRPTLSYSNAIRKGVVEQAPAEPASSGIARIVESAGASADEKPPPTTSAQTSGQVNKATKQDLSACVVATQTQNKDTSGDRILTVSKRWQTQSPTNLRKGKTNGEQKKTASSENGNAAADPNKQSKKKRRSRKRNARKKKLQKQKQKQKQQQKQEKEQEQETEQNTDASSSQLYLDPQMFENNGYHPIPDGMGGWMYPYPSPHMSPHGETFFVAAPPPAAMPGQMYFPPPMGLPYPAHGASPFPSPGAHESPHAGSASFLYPSPPISPVEMPHAPMAICQQVEFYFSDGNLKHDDFLRSQMDSNGFVAIAELAKFPRIMSLAPNASIVAEAISKSDKLEVQENRVRLRAGWDRYVQSATANDA